jgi:putative cell wall-binding protein
VIVLGGAAAVADGVASAAAAAAGGATLQRVAGSDRYATATRVADLAVDGYGWPASEALLARGDVFADALVGAALGGVRHAPIVLTPGALTLGDAATAWLVARRPSTVTALGGDGAVSAAVRASAAAIAGAN